MTNNTGLANAAQYVIQSGLQCPYTTQIDYVAGTNPIYIGVAPSGAAVTDALWQIKMITYNGASNPTSTTWATQGANNLVWNSRAGYTYS